MNIEILQSLCRSFPHTTESIKWGHDLVFAIGDKMFCVAGLDETPTSVSFKVADEDFEEMSKRPHFRPAPYVAKYSWVLIDDITKMKKSEWEIRLRKSYELVKEKLPPKTRKMLGL